MKLDKDRAVIIKNYEEMKKKLMNEGEILDSLCIKYSKYSKNAIKSLITDYKQKNKKNVENTKQNVKKVLGKKKDAPDMKAIENYIFGDGENPVKEVKEIQKKEVVVNNATTENKTTEFKDKPKDVKRINSSLKVKSIVVEDEEGREYIKENGIVKVGTETFENVSKLEEYKNKALKEHKATYDEAIAERKKEYEEMVAEINKIYDEERISFLKKINNIADVMMM